MNYKIEGDLDFYEELKKELSSNSSEKIKNEENICLLTNQELEDNFITLDCKHKFNIIPLYKEVCNQKIINSLETTYLLLNEIKCPYCRTVTPYLLPYIAHSSMEMKRSVNSPFKYCMKIHDCEWKIKSGKNKNSVCSKSAYKTNNGIYCNYHHQLVSNDKGKNCYDFKMDDEFKKFYTEISKKHTVVSLKKLLQKNKLRVTGTKPLLINRAIAANLV